MTSAGTVAVTGGAYSIAADFVELSALAGVLDKLATVLGDAAVVALQVLIDPHSLALAALDPVGAFDLASTASRTAVLATAAGAECVFLGVALGAAAQGYSAVDDLTSRWTPVVTALRRLPSAIAASESEAVLACEHGDPRRLGTALKTLVEHDPEVVTLALDAITTAGAAATAAQHGTASPTSASFGRPAALGHYSATLGTIYPDGKPVLTRHPTDPTDDSKGPPRDVADLLRGLECRNEHTDGGGIDVRFVSRTLADGSRARSVIVDVTGTKEWNALDRNDPNVANLGTNLRALGNEQTAYERGIMAALAASGVRSDEPIMLVGHSQGGIIAARLAADLARSPGPSGPSGSPGSPGSPGLNITHVVTAGAPIGLIDIPAHVQVLSFENSGDIVPMLDATENRHTVNQLTVTTNEGSPNDHGLGARHDLATAYLPAARDADASEDPSIAAWTASASAFLGGDDVSTQVYRVSRQP
ncbi:hypothetical protein ACSMXN_02635 [Jatrophihabitans sp. DSM 45814]